MGRVAQCSFTGCEYVSPGTRRGRLRRDLCPKHYQRLVRHGDASVTMHTHRRVTTGGYVHVWEPSHPLAKSDGYVAEHRKVVYDAGIPVPDGYHVHHANGDKTDNRLANLEVLSPSDHSLAHVGEYVVNQFGIWPRRNL